MKKLYIVLAAGLVAAVGGLVCTLQPESIEEPLVAPEIQAIEEVEQEHVEIRPICPEEVVYDKTITTVPVNYEDAQILMRIAMAEAGSDGVEGKAMVMAVVLNRVESDIFPDNVEDVVFQTGQFSPITDGRYEKSEPDVECHLALAAIEMGKYIDVDALFFASTDNCWAARNRNYLYTVGHHKFYD